MSKSVRISPTLNCDRLEVIRKGSVKISDLQKFMPASRTTATKEYETICRDIRMKEGREVGPWGIEVSRILKHFHLTENDIRRWAKDEEERMKGIAL